MQWRGERRPCLDIRIKLATDSVVKGGALTVDVKVGIVTLGGAVPTQQQKTRAEKLTKAVKGVRQVVNNITVRKGPPS
jgi:osmotically-inducible protein OsmY